MLDTRAREDLSGKQYFFGYTGKGGSAWQVNKTASGVWANEDLGR